MTTMTRRRCGDCQLCCRVLPTKEIDKPGNTRCRHQCRKGCAIYDDRPRSCRAWSCQWLLGFDVGQRPDRSHLVVDPMPDFVHVTDNATGETHHLAVVQVWIDPDHPDAHRDPAFRRWLDASRKVALIRYSSTVAGVLAPPSYTGAGWFEQTPKVAGLPEHNIFETLEAVGDQLGESVVIKVSP